MGNGLERELLDALDVRRERENLAVLENGTLGEYLTVTQDFHVDAFATKAFVIESEGSAEAGILSADVEGRFRRRVRAETVFELLRVDSERVPFDALVFVQRSPSLRVLLVFEVGKRNGAAGLVEVVLGNIGDLAVLGLVLDDKADLVVSRLERVTGEGDNLFSGLVGASQLDLAVQQDNDFPVGDNFARFLEVVLVAQRIDDNLVDVGIFFKFVQVELFFGGGSAKAGLRNRDDVFGVVVLAAVELGNLYPVIIGNQDVLDADHVHFAFKDVASGRDTVLDGFFVVGLAVPAVKAADIIDFAVVLVNHFLQLGILHLAGFVVMDGRNAVTDEMPGPAIDK